MLVAAAERREHVGRVSVRPLRREHGERRCTAPARSGAPRAQQFIGATYSSFFSYVNLIGLLLQMFVVSRVFKFLGVGAVAVHPSDRRARRATRGMLRAPSFEFIRWLKIADNSLDYSLGNTTKQALWLPTSREASYKAKQAVDSFCVRAGDVLTGRHRLYGRARVVHASRHLPALNVVFASAGWPPSGACRAGSCGPRHQEAGVRRDVRPPLPEMKPRRRRAGRYRRRSRSASPQASRSACSSGSGRPRAERGRRRVHQAPPDDRPAVS